MKWNEKNHAKEIIIISFLFIPVPHVHEENKKEIHNFFFLTEKKEQNSKNCLNCIHWIVYIASRHTRKNKSFQYKRRKEYKKNGKSPSRKNNQEQKNHHQIKWTIDVSSSTKKIFCYKDKKSQSMQQAWWWWSIFFVLYVRLWSLRCIHNNWWCQWVGSVLVWLEFKRWLGG